MINSYIFSKRFFVKSERFSDASIESITKIENVFIEIHKVFEFKI